MTNSKKEKLTNPQDFDLTANELPVSQEAATDVIDTSVASGSTC